MANGNFMVFPAIGVARAGNSATDFYLAPEEPGALPLRVDGRQFTSSDFRDEQKQLRRQAARFVVYHADTAEEPIKPGDTIGEKIVDRIEWTVHLANKKAAWYEFRTNIGEHGYPSGHPLRNSDVQQEDERKALIIDPGPRTVISAAGSVDEASFSRDGGGTFPPPTKPREIDTLGELRTDSGGALLVLGGHGDSGSKHQTPQITHYANNDGWWDDTSDGPVSATIVFTNGTTEAAEQSWAIVGPPAYAPQIINLVTLYDTMFDVAVRHGELRPAMYRDARWQPDYTPDFASEIKPILDRASLYPWVVAIPPKVHTFDFPRLGDPDPQYNDLRQYFLEVLRAPTEQNTLESPKTGYRMMPYLAGDDSLGSSQQSSKYLKLTDTQYFLLSQWAEGKFTLDGPLNNTSEIENHPGHKLTWATLENCVGGAFSPGIEMTWLCRNPDIYSQPFRIKVSPDLPTTAGELHLWPDPTEGLEPGDVTKYMALPWQADFNECSVQPIDDHFVWWWPAQRPIFVYAKHIKDNEWNHVAWVGTIRDQNAADYVIFADDIEMVEHWSELGFVVHKETPATSPEGELYAFGKPEDPDYIEVQRTLKRAGYVSD